MPFFAQYILKNSAILDINFTPLHILCYLDDYKTLDIFLKYCINAGKFIPPVNIIILYA